MNWSAVIFFRTERLAFRRFDWTDLAALSRISADDRVSKYVGDGRPLTEAATRRWIEQSRANIERYGYGTGAVAGRDNGQLVGWAGIARPEDGPEELIYGLAFPAWGKGLGTELLVGLLRWAGESLAKEELRATVYPANKASIRMLLKQGFVLVDDCYLGDENSWLYHLDLQAWRRGAENCSGVRRQEGNA
jgi:RimJ/RimL family protein N-acetyltransferase